MIGLPLAHVGPFPVEETIGMYGPGILLFIGAGSTLVRARLRRLRRRQPGPGTES
jgi:hypothetical protein